MKNMTEEVKVGGGRDGDRDRSHRRRKKAETEANNFLRVEQKKRQ